MQTPNNLPADVVALAAANIATIDALAKATYDDEGDQVILGYLSVLLMKMAMDEIIDKSFKDPLGFRMSCLDIVKDLYAKVSE
ncbi:MAG: hypothetical protein LC687_00575 [Actinobacteria bacterium]|nr:hypothetical protein [Actinomycetota bacterium]MCA1806361.1 hypothetical protein [Actinomycetota bacterium]